MYSHIGQGGAMDLILLQDTRVGSYAYPVGALNSPGAPPPAATLADVRAYIVGERTTDVWSVLGLPDVAVINSSYGVGAAPPPFISNQALVTRYMPFVSGGWMINTTLALDARNQTQFGFLVFNTQSLSTQLINCHIDVFNAPVPLVYMNQYQDPMTATAGATLTNSIVSFDTTAYTQLHLLNDAAHLRHNAYYMPRVVQGGLEGYTNDPGAATLAARFAAGTIPGPGSPLYDGGADVGLEYDQLGRPRGSRRTIGPLTAP
jgi:hypothetical protein